MIRLTPVPSSTCTPRSACSDSRWSAVTSLTERVSSHGAASTTVTVAPVLRQPGHRLADHEAIHLAEIVNEPLLPFDVPPSGDRARKVITDAGLTPVPGRGTTNVEMLRCLVARGLDWAIMVQPWPTNTSYEGLPIVSRPIADPVKDFDIVLAWAAGARLTSRAAAVAAFFRRKASPAFEDDAGRR
jgi:DNA-binding transcriptional LysR family regulator